MEFRLFFNKNFHLIANVRMPSASVGSKSIDMWSTSINVESTILNVESTTFNVRSTLNIIVVNNKNEQFST